MAAGDRRLAAAPGTWVPRCANRSVTESPVATCARSFLAQQRRPDVEDLVDAQRVADLLGLAQWNTVSLYQRRYPDMPRPVVDLGRGRCKMWLRTEIEA